MRRPWRLLLGALAILGAVSAPTAARVLTAEQAQRMDIPVLTFTCPLGGATFRQPVGFPHFPLETFPDGSHMGDEWVDTQIPECPGNGLLLLPDIAASEARNAKREEDAPLLIYHTYTATELARLPALLASPEWQALAGQTRSLRAFWLATWLDRPADDRLQLLEWAGWGSDTADQHTTALTAIVDHMPGVIDQLPLPDDGRGAMVRGFRRYQVVNALRELGRFDEALALLEAVETATPGVPMAEDPDAIYGPSGQAEPMRRAIAARDSDRFAIDLLGDDMAGRVCGDDSRYAHYRGASTQARCTAREQRFAAEQAQSDAVYALLDDRAALAPRCTAPLGSDAVLIEACRRMQFDIDWQAGGELFETDPAAAFAQCEATPEEQRSTQQQSACTAYDIYLPSALTDLLLANLPAYNAICDAETTVGYTPFGSACTEAERQLSAAQARALWADQRALRQQCRKDTWREDYAFNGIDMACQSLEEGIREPYWMQASGEDEERTDAPYLAALPYARQHLAAELARRAGTEID